MIVTNGIVKPESIFPGMLVPPYRLDLPTQQSHAVGVEAEGNRKLQKCIGCIRLNCIEPVRRQVEEEAMPPLRMGPVY